MFDPQVKEELIRRLRILEQHRLERKKKMRVYWLLTLVPIAAGIVVYMLYWPMYPEYLIVPGIVFVAMLLIALFVGHKTKKKIVSRFKSEVIMPSLKKKHPNLNYNQHASVSKGEFVASELFSSFRVNRFNGEDLFMGVEGKTAYKFSEVHAEERRTRTDSKGRTQTYYVTIFKGIFMIADFNKELQYTTRVVQAADGFFEKLFAGKSKVTLEHPEFEKMFNTYSQDQVEARYILTPAMMERVLALQKDWNTKINMSFKGNHLFVAISHNYNHFEPQLNKEIDLEQIERVFDEVESCLGIVNTLDLNTRIWTKD